jgi:hypothetical protein
MLFIHYLKNNSEKSRWFSFLPPSFRSSVHHHHPSSSPKATQSRAMPCHSKQPNKPSKQIKVILYRYPAIEESRPLQSNPSRTGVKA